METNWIIIGIVAFCIIILIVFILRKNLKDKKDLTKFLNNDYKNTNENESELNDEDE